MELAAAGLKEQPFRSDGRPVVFVTYEGQANAYAFLNETCTHNSGLALFQGPSLSGKSTILRQFAAEHRQQCSIAIINGIGLDKTELLTAVLKSFGYGYEFESVNELFGMLKVFMCQQTAKLAPPLLIIEDAHRLNASALSVLAELAEVRVREKYALKIILISDRAINNIVRSPALGSMAKRLTGDFHLEPMTMAETNDYVRAKMRYVGCPDPDKIIPEYVCDEIHRASGGWPGVVDRLCVLALAKAQEPPLGPECIEHPTIPEGTGTAGVAGSDIAASPNSPKNPYIFLTHNGKSLQKIEFKGSRLIIGRSQHNDVTVDSKFISRHHTLLVRNGTSTLLMDLNSANGTYVNSWRVSNQVLQHNDVITIGEHGLKFVHVAAQHRTTLEETHFNDTTVMQSMADMRRVLAREHTEVMPEPEIRSVDVRDSA